MVMVRNKKYEHDEKTCFRCRLHALVDELYPKGIDGIDEGRFVLVALAEAAGQMLVDCEEEDFMLLIIYLIRLCIKRLRKNREGRFKRSIAALLKGYSRPLCPCLYAPSLKTKRPS
jgi:hypothetical protein